MLAPPSRAWRWSPLRLVSRRLVQYLWARSRRLTTLNLTFERGHWYPACGTLRTSQKRETSLEGARWANERLRSCIGAASLTIADVASAAEVDPKTVERWITTQRTPHRRHRDVVASLLRTPESYLWPDLLGDGRANSTSEAELVCLYPNRAAVPWQLWTALLEEATEHIDILVYSGLFLPDVFPDVCQTLIEKSEQGVRVRLALGDPACEAVRLRGQEEGIGDGMAGRISLTLKYLCAAIEAPIIDARLHTTTLYNSIFRFDSNVLINAHVWGSPAAQSPVFHLRKLDGGRLLEHYETSFERIWAQAIPAASTTGAPHLDSH